MNLDLTSLPIPSIVSPQKSTHIFLMQGINWMCMQASANETTKKLTFLVSTNCYVIKVSEDAIEFISIKL